MSFKGILLAAGFFSLSVSVHAQIESESLDDLSSWGQRFLPETEPEFSSDLWRNSDNQTLLALLQSIDVRSLGPAEKRLLRRIVLSPATRPRGERAEDLLAQRARLMLELGEARAAAAVAPELGEDSRGLDPETFAIDLDLASGQEASACRALNGATGEAHYWYKLRAVCAVLQDNFSGAELAIEIAEAQGVEDDWMIAAIFAAAGDVPNPPNARFDTGLNIALSAKADLDMSSFTLDGGRPDLSAAAARRPGIPNDLRVRFAEIASEFELISVEERRAILKDRFDSEEAATFSALEVALADLKDPLVSDGERHSQLSGVLRAAALADLTTYRTTASLFLPDLQQLVQTPVAADFAIDYAKAAMIAGDRETALDWLNTFNFEGSGEPDPYQIAVIEALDILAGGEASRPSLVAIEARLIEAVDSNERERQAGAILAAWTGLGYPVSPLGRDFIAQLSDRGERMAQGQQIGLRAAVLSGAVAESGLLVLATTRGEPGRLASPDFTDLLAALVALGAEDIARELAIESTEFWKDP
ncbi:MAG: hypothetical protein ACE37M_08640 [Henriciella sp.]